MEGEVRASRIKVSNCIKPRTNRFGLAGGYVGRFGFLGN